jgi:hypothetical protein
MNRDLIDLIRRRQFVLARNLLGKDSFFKVRYTKHNIVVTFFGNDVYLTLEEGKGLNL